MKKVLITIILCICLIGCDNKDLADYIYGNEDSIIIDVRDAWEYNNGHVVDSINIPYTEIDENINLDKSKTIYVYCQSGRRSALAAATLKKLGYKVSDLGGYDSVNLPKE